MRTYIPKKLKGTIKAKTVRSTDNGGYNWSNDPFSDPFELLSKRKLTAIREVRKIKYELNHLKKK